MNGICKIFTVSALSLVLATPATFAQDHHDDHGQNQNQNQYQNQGRPDDHRSDDHRQGGGPGPGNGYVHHNDWQRGHRMNNNDWSRGQRIDYRQYHLRAPRRGYEWRQVDGNYVMAAVATGLIASVIVASSNGGR